MIRQINLILFTLLFCQISFGQRFEIKGKIIDEKFNPLSSVTIENISSNEIVRSDKNGNYFINGNVNDTLLFNFVGLTEELRIIDKKIINVILIDKSLNCLGEPWTERKWKKEKQKIDKYYMKLNLIADKENHWEIVK